MSKDPCEYGPCEQCSYPGDRCKDDVSREEKETAERVQKYEEVLKLWQKGMSEKAIARYLGINLRTVQRRMLPPSS